MVRGGRAQDCPGVKYHLVRGALDLVRSPCPRWNYANADDCAGWCRKPNHVKIEVRNEEAQEGRLEMLYEYIYTCNIALA
jgi:hypothetical protein